jgi:hypothetical protein
MDRTASLPSLAQQLQYTNVYFQRCHNQPYCYFHERLFYRRVRDKSLPPYLILAVLATAARFTPSVALASSEDSDEEFADVYARRSWAIIMQQTIVSGYHVHLHLVQATNLLAVIDFTSECSCPKTRVFELTLMRFRWICPSRLDENRSCYPLRTRASHDV